MRAGRAMCSLAAQQNSKVVRSPPNTTFPQLWRVGIKHSGGGFPGAAIFGPFLMLSANARWPAEACTAPLQRRDSMRRRLLALLAVASVIACETPEDDEAVAVDIAAATAAVRARSEAAVAAEVRQDTEAVMAFWASDAIVQGVGMPQLQGLEQIREMFGGFLGTGAVKEFGSTTTHLRVAASGDLAYEYGTSRMVITGPDGDLVDLGKFITIWENRGGEWYITAMSFSSDAASPAPAEH